MPKKKQTKKTKLIWWLVGAVILCVVLFLSINTNKTPLDLTKCDCIVVRNGVEYKNSSEINFSKNIKMADEEKEFFSSNLCVSACEAYDNNVAIDETTSRCVSNERTTTNVKENGVVVETTTTNKFICMCANGNTIDKEDFYFVTTNDVAGGVCDDVCDTLCNRE